jgi:hypothetical protein
VYIFARAAIVRGGFLRLAGFNVLRKKKAKKK